MNLQSSDFEFFDIPARFAQERTTLDARWKSLQREAHPDKFSHQGAAAQRVAMQWSVRINEAYQRLKDPLRRAAYLCELNGAPVNAENNTAMPAEFLMQQMAWRESLDDAVSPAELDQISFEVASARRQALQKCEQLLDVEHHYAQAVQQVRALMFIERFARDIEDRLEACDQSNSQASSTPPGTAGRGQ
ncbi:MAG: Fe-S protein assembly co-chaperone HscB [Rhodoferax sp.]|nr:Fe-S protein assembly co-chaperone HscB [Rhodoferax sp.]